MRKELLPAMFLLCAAAVAQDLKPIVLPKPQTSGGKPLMEVLAERKSSRVFRDEKLSAQELSNLLWAGFGINRSDGRRTAPSAHNWQEVDIFVVMAEGLFRYDAQAHALQPVAGGDLRPLAGTQSFVRTAPVNLIYVADLARTGSAPDETHRLYAAVSAGAIVQNVYLYCASVGLAAVVRASLDEAGFSKAAKLGPNQRVLVAQTVGYPKK
jgi:SagB-type dehydrogenase family enzyme